MTVNALPQYPEGGFEEGWRFKTPNLNVFSQVNIGGRKITIRMCCRDVLTTEK